MATAANSLAKADHFLRRARTPPATRRPCATLPRPQPLMRRHFDIPAGASRRPAAFAADGRRTPTGRRPLPRPNIPAAALTPQCQHTIHPTPRFLLGGLTFRRPAQSPRACSHIHRHSVFPNRHSGESRNLCLPAPLH